MNGNGYNYNNIITIKKIIPNCSVVQMRNYCLMFIVNVKTVKSEQKLLFLTKSRSYYYHININIILICL